MYKPFYFLITLSFFMGLLQMIGFSLVYTKIISEMTIILVFLASLQRRSVFKTPSFMGFAFFFGVFLLSAIVNNDMSANSFTFFRPFIMSFAIMFASYSTELTNRQFSQLLSIIFYLALLQIPVSWIKLGVMGSSEKYVGTFSITGGSLHTIFPLLAIGFVLGLRFFYKKTTSQIFIIMGLIFFGITGLKKAIPFYFIFILFLASFLYYYVYLKRSIIFSRLISQVLGGGLVFLVGLALIPGLNPEQKFGGRIDFDFLSDKVYAYSFYDSRIQSYRGRFGGNYILVKEMLFENKEWIKEKETKNIFFGFGPTSFYGDNYLAENENLFANIYRFIPTGFYRTFFTLGIFGFIGFVWFYGAILIKLWKRFRRMQNLPPMKKAILFGSLLGLILIFLDFFSYSNTYAYPTIYISLFIIVGQVLRFESPLPNNMNNRRKPLL